MDREGSHTVAVKRPAAHLAAESDPELADEQVDPDVVTRKLNNHLVPWLFSLGVLCYLDRTNLSFAALELNRDLGLTCSTYGLGAALFFVSYALFQMPSTMICARLGAPTWLSANIVAWGAVACLFAAANSVPAFLALRFLLGATESAAFPGMWYHLSLFYPADTSEPGHSGAAPTGLGAAYAKVASCTALAQVLGAPLAAAILTMDGLAGLRGWQWLFLLEGAATVVFGAVLRFALAPSPAKARMLTHAEREWLVERQARAAARQGTAGGSGGREGGGGGMLAALKRPLAVVRDWRMLWMAGCWLLVAAVIFGMTFFMPLLVAAMFSEGGSLISGGAGSAHHGGCSGGGHSGAPTAADQRRTVLVALASAIPFIAAAVGMNINARLAERANERHRHAGVPILLASATLAVTPLALRFVGPGLAFTCLSLAAGFCWSFHGPFFSWPAVFLSGEQAAAGFAFINSVGAVGGFIGPFLLGRLSDRADGGFTAAMVMLACFLGASGTCLLLFPAPGHRPSEGGRDKERPSDDGSSHAILPHGGLGADGAEEEGVPLAGGSSSGEHAGWGSAAAVADEEHPPWRQQQREQQMERLRGVGSSSGRSLSRKGSRGDLEFQPILPAAGQRSA
ncbi:hypothetical protein ABPG75_002192 [Micractinium tetrahymenae]